MGETGRRETVVMMEIYIAKHTETERERGENTAWQESRGACTAKGAERLIPSLAPSIIFFMKRRSSSDSVPSGSTPYRFCRQSRH